MHVFNSASRQHCEVWASQFPFFHCLKDVVPPNEVIYIYGHINWSLAQFQQQPTIGLSQSFPPKGGSKARPGTGFHFILQKKPVLESRGAFLAKRPHLESRIETHPGGKKSAGDSVPASSADARKKGGMGVSTPDVSQSTASSSISSSVFQVGMLSNFWIIGEALLLTGLVPNMVQGHYLQLRSALTCSITSVSLT